MLILRPYTLIDWPVLSQYQYPGISESEAKSIITQWNTRQYDGRYFETFAIEVGKSIVGYISLLEQEAGTASIGVEVYPPYRRQGFAYSALKLLFEQTTEFHTITSQVRTDNTASLALHDKLGFHITERFTNRLGHDVFTLSLSLPQEIATSLRSSQ